MTVDYVEIVTGPGGATSLSDYDTISVMILGGVHLVILQTVLHLHQS